jgi:hypothetical protein
MYVCIIIHFLLKKIVLLILVSVFLFNVIGYVLVYEFLKFSNNAAIEKQISNGISSDKQVVLSFPLSGILSVNSSFRWVKTGKEFVFNKQCYDIVSKEIKRDTVFFHCIRDTKEEHIILSYRNTVKKNAENNNGRRKANQLFSKLAIDYYCNGVDINLFYKISKPILYSYLCIYKSWETELTSPPPEFFI